MTVQEVNKVKIVKNRNAICFMDIKLPKIYDINKFEIRL